MSPALARALSLLSWISAEIVGLTGGPLFLGLWLETKLPVPPMVLPAGLAILGFLLAIFRVQKVARKFSEDADHDPQD